MSLSMTQILILIMILPTSSTNLHNTNTRHTRVSFVEGTLTRVLIVKPRTHPSLIRVPVTIKTLVLTNLYSILRVSHSSSTVVSSVEVHIIVMIAKQGSCPSMIRVLVTIKTLVITNLHFILRISNNSTTVVRENNRILEEMLRTQMPNSLVVLNEPEGSDDYTEVTYDKEQCLSDHYTAPVTPLAYTPSIPFLATTDPADTLLMEDEVISTIPVREDDEFIKFSVDDLVPILKESEETFDSILECDMPATTPLPPTNNGEVDFDINSSLGEQVVDFLMENVDVADLPRHMVMITKPSYDVTFSNPLFDFNDDYTLCYDNPLFDKEFKDISSLDPFKLTLVIDEPTLLVTLPLPCIDALGDAIVDIALPLGEHLDTLSTGDREIDFNPSRDIEELERLLTDDPVPVPRVFDEPLGNSDSMSRSSKTSYLFEELIAEFGLDDSIPTKIDDRYQDSEGDILYFEHLLNEDTSSDVSPALLPIECSSRDLPLLDHKQICLKEVERFDPFFSLTQSGGKTRVMETPSFGFHHMPSPRPVAYSPKEVMYRYYHPHLTLGGGFDHGPKMK
ncbi:hypothetical protein Tco_1206326 [Tanacetum coccineum]